MFQTGDKVVLKEDLKRLIASTNSYFGFIDNKKIYTVVHVGTDPFGDTVCELNNDGLRYLIKHFYLEMYKEVSVGFLIED